MSGQTVSGQTVLHKSNHLPGRQQLLLPPPLHIIKPLVQGLLCIRVRGCCSRPGLPATCRMLVSLWLLLLRLLCDRRHAGNAKHQWKVWLRPSGTYHAVRSASRKFARRTCSRQLGGKGASGQLGGMRVGAQALEVRCFGRRRLVQSLRSGSRAANPCACKEQSDTVAAVLVVHYLDGT